MKEFQNVLPLNIQFFAEEGADESGAENNDPEQDNGSDDNGSENNNTSSQKTFTQEQVSAMMAKEKKEGRAAMLRSLGYASEKEAKDAAALLKSMLDSQKSEPEKLKEDMEKAAQEKSDAELRAKEAEDKLTCFTEGVNKDSITDVLAIASMKVTDEKPLEKVLKEMKKDARYASFFGSADGSGTGNEPGHNGTNAKAGELGKRLAEKNVPKTDTKKSSFF